MIVLLTGSRHITSEAAVAEHLKPLFDADPAAVLYHGAARGVDSVGDAVWASWGGKTEPFPARWQECGRGCPPGHLKVTSTGWVYCPTAGFRRNQMMVGHAVLEMQAGVEVRGLALLAAGRKNAGTRDCLRRAREACIEMDERTVEVA